MNNCMTFPKTVEEFMEQNKMVDTEQVYSNGVEYVPIFRMRQWFEHLPSAERAGKWIPWKAYYGTDKKSWEKAFKCSVCEYGWGDEDYKFCPMCGAMMEGVENERFD